MWYTLPVNVDLGGVMRTSKKLTIPCVFAGLFVVGVYIAGFQLMGLRMVRDMGLADTTLSTVVAVHFVALVVYGIFFGRFADKIGKKKVIAFGFVAFIAGCVMISTSQNIAMLAVGIFVTGCGFGAIEVLTMAVLADVFPEKSHKYVNIAQTFFGVGCMVSPVVCQALLNSGLSWRDIIFGVGVVAVLCMALVLFSNMKRVQRECSVDDSALPVKKIVQNKIFVYLCIGMLIYVGMETSAAFFADLYFEEAVNAPELSAIALSGFWLAMSAVRLLAGIFAFNRLKTLVFGFGISIISVVLLIFVSNGTFAVINYILLGLLYGAMFPNIMSITQDVFPANTGTASSLVFVSAGVGGGVMPMLLGVIMISVPVNIAMLTIAVFSVLGAVISILLKRKIKRENITLALR